jgi:hypothetical protein
VFFNAESWAKDAVDRRRKKTDWRIGLNFIARVKVINEGVFIMTIKMGVGLEKFKGFV